MKIHAVIGMNYGDEGKGHIVSHLSDANTLNVKFNGGAQAGHSVVLADGREHVFHQFGSGTLRGARTLFSQHFIVNPLAFLKELNELLGIGAPVREVFIDPLCRVTTPFDMLLNEYASRQKNTTATCGMGINETVERSQYRQLRIVCRDLVDKSADQLKRTMRTIENEYLPYRIEQLGVSAAGFRVYAIERLGGLDIVDKFLDYAKWMVEKSVMWETCDLIERYNAKAPGRKIVFEAGQGMLLDQDRRKFMPYLTRSSTGMRNVAEVLKRLRSNVDFTAHLVTRAYLTRHGEGPMMNEIAGTPYANVTDPTNPENPFQGRMRYGYLDVDWYDKALGETTLSLPHGGKVDVALTCVDQVDQYERGNARAARLSYMKNGKINKCKIADLREIQMISVGRTEKDVEPMLNA